jgi:hypothetical protein
LTVARVPKGAGAAKIMLGNMVGRSKMDDVGERKTG